MHLPRVREATPKGFVEGARGSTSQPLTRDGESAAGSGKRVLGEDARTEQASVNEPGAIARWSPLSTEGVLDSSTNRL